jgi:hypothetical protein
LASNRFQPSWSDSSAARRPSVRFDQLPSCAARTAAVASNSRVPAGQLDEFPFATVSEDCLTDHAGWLFQLVVEETAPV